MKNSALKDFYVFESKDEALGYCRSMANVLHRRGDERVLGVGIEEFVEECMADLNCVIKFKDKKRTEEELDQASVFLKNCLLSIDKFPYPKK